MSKYFYRIFTIIDLHFGAMRPCSSGLGMTLEASDFRSVRRLVAYSIYLQSLDAMHVERTLSCIKKILSLHIFYLIGHDMSRVVNSWKQNQASISSLWESLLLLWRQVHVLNQMKLILVKLQICYHGKT